VTVLVVVEDVEASDDASARKRSLEIITQAATSAGLSLQPVVRGVKKTG